MAHAVRFQRAGGPEVLRYEAVEVGDPGPGEVRLRHVAVGLNYADTYFRNGTYPIPLPAGIDRIPWLPHTMPGSPWSVDLYTLAALSPMFVWDVARNGRVHKAYLIFAAAYLPCAIAVHALWNSEWWHGVVPRLMGVG